MAGAVAAELGGGTGLTRVRRVAHVALEAPAGLSQTPLMGDPAVDITDLTPQQRLELIEQLWDSLTPDEVPLTPAQSAELQRRLDRLDREGVSGRSWDEVERRIRGAR